MHFVQLSCEFATYFLHFFFSWVSSPIPFLYFFKIGISHFSSGNTQSTWYCIHVISIKGMNLQKPKNFFTVISKEKNDLDIPKCSNMFYPKKKISNMKFVKIEVYSLKKKKKTNRPFEDALKVFAFSFSGGNWCLTIFLLFPSGYLTIFLLLLSG